MGAVSLVGFVVSYDSKLTKGKKEKNFTPTHKSLNQQDDFRKISMF